MAATGLLLRPTVQETVHFTFGRSRSSGYLPSLRYQGMKIFLSLGNGDALLPLRVLGSDTVGSLKLLSLQGFKEWSYSASQVQLVYGGRELSRDDFQLKDYGICAGEVVHMLIRSSDRLFIQAKLASGTEFPLLTGCLRSSSAKDLKHRTPDSRGGLPLNKQLLSHQSIFLDKSSRDSELHSFGGSQLSLLTRVQAQCWGATEGKQPATRDRRESSFTLQPLSKLPLSGAQLQLLCQVRAGLAAGHSPILSSAGSGGCYFMPREDGLASTAVFKPMDEEPLAINCPRGLPVSTTREGLKVGTVVGEGAMREVAAYVLDSTGMDPGFSGVPLTMMVTVAHDAFHVKKPGVQGMLKAGSLQRYIEADSNCEDMGPSKFPVQEVHKIAVLDIRLANADRNGSNILVCGHGDAMKLVPIDHGYCLPEKFEDCTFEWLYWPQAKVPISDNCRKYIASLDAERDLMVLEEHGWPLSKPCARVLRVATLLLKAGTKHGLTLYDIASMMVRDHLNEPSAMELMVLEAEQKVLPGSSEALFLLCFQEVMEARLMNLVATACAEE